MAGIKEYTLADAITRYKASVLPNKAAATQRDQTKQLAWWERHYGQVRMTSVTPALLVEARDKLIATPLLRNQKPTGRCISASTVTSHMAVMSHLLRTAQAEWQWIPTNPAVSIKKPTRSNARTRFLNDDELRRLLHAVEQSKSQHLRPAFMLALTTGAQKNEILSLEWSQIDLVAQRVTLSGEKTRQPRTVALSAEVVQLLRSLPRRIDTPLLFPGMNPLRPVEIKKAWRTALRLAEVTDFRWNDLRHTAVSFLAMDGASLAEIAGVLGHKTLAMVQRCSHLSDEHLATASTRIADRVAKVAQ